MTSPSADKPAARPLVLKFLERAATDPLSVAYAVYPHAISKRGVRKFTWGEWASQSRAVAGALISSNVARGDRVAILSSNKLLWPVAEMGVSMCGAISVGLHTGSKTNAIVAALADCGARTVIVDTLVHLQQLLDARKQLPYTVTVICEDLAPPHADPRPNVVAWSDWCAHGSQSLDTNSAFARELSARLQRIGADDIATLMYDVTSAGDAIAACLTHRYLAASAHSFADTLDLTDDDTSLSWLPFSDPVERVLGLYTRIHVGMAAALVEQPADVFAIARQYEPTVIVAQARTFEDIYDALQTAGREGKEARWELVAHVGSRFRIAVSDSSQRDDVSLALSEVGLPVLSRYGGTEQLCVAMHRHPNSTFDSVGPIMPGARVRIGADGELQVFRGDLASPGYWKRDGALRGDEWIRTGDLATINDDGHLRITGRVNEVIALTTGTIVDPLPIELALAKTPYIEHAVCHGHQREFLSVLLALRRSEVEAWARTQGLSLPWEALAQHSLLRAELQHAVSTVNAERTGSPHVFKFAITEHEFTVEGGELNSARVVVRAVVNARFRHVMDELYES